MPPIPTVSPRFRGSDVYKRQFLYRFDEAVRLEVRQELHLSKDVTVVGHVGRFNRQKNHEFLLEVFHKYVQEFNPTAHLLLVGTGELQKAIQKKVQQFRLTDQVHLLGGRPDVNRLLQAMDLFLFPSFMEGLSVSMVEAQCAGLPCVCLLYTSSRRPCVYVERRRME